MENYSGNADQRGQPRVSLELPTTIRVGSQITVKGQLKDLSLSSAFIRIKNIIYLKVNDEVGITIESSTNDISEQIQGVARISRIVPGEGFAVYFTNMDENSLKCVKKLLQKSGINS